VRWTKGYVLPVIVALLVVGAVALLVYFEKSLGSDNVDASSRWSLQNIEKVVGALADKDPAAVISVVTLFGDEVKEENERTVLLQQRASSLLSGSIVAVSIILASVGIMLKDLRGITKGRSIAFFVLPIVLVLGASLYWTWDGFGALPFATFNTDNLLENVSKPGADLVTTQIVAVQQRYQVVKTNGSLNNEKAEALRWATANLFLGLFMFSAFCLSLLTLMNEPISNKGGGTDGK